MKIENIAITDLTPYARNSRTHSAEQIEQIAASITEFGFTNPVLIDAKGEIIAGHGRVMAARSLGLHEVSRARRQYSLHTYISRTPRSRNLSASIGLWFCRIFRESGSEIG